MYYDVEIVGSRVALVSRDPTISEFFILKMFHCQWYRLVMARWNGGM